MLRYLAALAAVLWLFGCGDERAPQHAGDEPVAGEEAVREAAQAFLTRGRLPGLALAVFNRNGVAWSSGFGVADLDEAGEVTADTSFWLASVTKPITGLALLRAQEEGALTLETPIQALLDERGAFAIGTPFAASITLEHLVTHRSSIVDADAYQCAYFLGEENGLHVSLANELSGTQLCDDAVPADLGGFLGSYLSEGGRYYSGENFAASAPGSAYSYSNVGAALAGYAVELATGSSLADYAREQFFEPLGLENTAFRLAELERSNVATPHVWDAEAGRSVALPFYDLSTWPDGGLRSSANDLGTLLVAVMRGGELDGTRILEAASVEQALAPHASSDADQVGVFWELATTDELGDDQRVRHFVWHNGSDPGAFSYVLFDRDAQVGFVILANGELDFEDAELGERLQTLVAELDRLATALAERGTSG